MSKCSVGWCVLLPLTGSSVCAVHKRAPVLHSFETAKDYWTRIRRQDAAAKTAARKAAESDAALAARGRVTGSR